MPPKIRPNAPQNIKSINTDVANSNEKPLSVSNGTRCIIGIDIHTQQKITAQLIHATTSFSERAKSVSSSAVSVLALILATRILVSTSIVTSKLRVRTSLSTSIIFLLVQVAFCHIFH